MTGVQTCLFRSLIHNSLEIRNRIPRIQPAEIAAFGGRTVLRKEPGQLLEFCTVLQPLMEIVETAFGLDIGNQLIDLDQDMTGMGLLHLRRHGRAAFGQQLARIRTLTNRTKTCCATITPLDSFLWKCKGTIFFLLGNYFTKNILGYAKISVTLSGFWTGRGSYALLDPIDPSSDAERPGYAETQTEIRRQVLSGEAILVFFQVGDWLDPAGGGNWVTRLTEGLPVIYQDESEWVIGTQ